MSEYSVELKGLNKVYSNLLKEDTVALKDINLQIRPGEFISIIGPSGCRKINTFTDHRKPRQTDIRHDRVP